MYTFSQKTYNSFHVINTTAETREHLGCHGHSENSIFNENERLKTNVETTTILIYRVPYKMTEKKKLIININMLYEPLSRLYYNLFPFKLFQIKNKCNTICVT